MSSDVLASLVQGTDAACLLKLRFELLKGNY